MAARDIDLNRRPTNRGKWIRWAVAGLQSTGKTTFCLKAALALGQRVLYIDTEIAGPDMGASELFAEQFPSFIPFPWLPPYSPQDLADTIERYQNEVDVIVVDSLSAFWTGEGGTLSIKDEAQASGRYGRHEGAGWSEATPEQDAMVRAIQNARCHVICAMRAKKLWDMAGGKMDEIGVGVVQRPGVDYEFTFGILLDRDRRITVDKSRINSGGISIPIGTRFKADQHSDLIEQVVAWCGTAESALISPDHLDEIDRMWERFAEGPPRNIAKAEFMRAFGATPSELLANQFDSATRWISDYADRLADGTPDEIAAKAIAATRAEEPPGPTKAELDEAAAEMKAAKKAPRKAAAKKKTPKKTAKRQVGGRKPTKRPSHRASVPPGEPWDDPGPDTPETSPTSQNGSTGLSEGDCLRAQLTDVYLQMTGPYGLQAETALMDAELWPIDKIPDAKIQAAFGLVAPIGEAFRSEAEKR